MITLKFEISSETWQRLIMDVFNQLCRTYETNLALCGSKRSRTVLRKALMTAFAELSSDEQVANLGRIPP
jgi:hypothetical protein